MMVFVNLFSVHGDAEQFERAFLAGSDFMRARPGFLRHRLVRSARQPRTYLNIAEWEDEESFRRATEHPDFEAHVAELRELAETVPHLCRPVLEREAAGGG